MITGLIVPNARTQTWNSHPAPVHTEDRPYVHPSSRPAGRSRTDRSGRVRVDAQPAAVAGSLGDAGHERRRLARSAAAATIEHVPGESCVAHGQGIDCSENRPAGAGRSVCMGPDRTPPDYSGDPALLRPPRAALLTPNVADLSQQEAGGIFTGTAGNGNSIRTVTYRPTATLPNASRAGR